MISLQDKHAFITGAGTGIGAKCAELFAQAGATVALADIDHASVTAIVADLAAKGHKATAHKVDVTKAASVAAAYAEAEAQHGGLDTFVHCAGVIGKNLNIQDMSEADYDFVVDINMKGVWLCTRQAAKLMLASGRKGSITNISSILGIIGQFGMTAYGSSKAAVVSISYNAAIELGQHGIRVNSVLPGHTRTKMFFDSGSNTVEDTLLRIYPLKRWAKPRISPIRPSSSPRPWQAM